MPAQTNILLPTDFSETSWQAMCYAANLYKNKACNFYIINTTDIPFHQIETNVMTDMSSSLRKGESSVEETMSLFEDLDHHADSQFKLVAHLGTINGSITNLLDSFDEQDETFIMMSTKGATEISDYLFGTVTSNVARNIDLPIYCIPESAALDNPKNIMLAVDDKILKESEVLTVIADLAKTFGSHIHIVNVSNQSCLFCEDAPERFVIQQYLTGVNHTFLSIKGSYVQDELMLYAGQNKIDLIVMIKRKKGFWQNLFETSNTKNMSLYSKKPLLILKE